MKLDRTQLEVAKLQVPQLKKDLDFYNKLSKGEYEAFKEFIDKPQKILELGCGLGRMSVYLNKQLDYEPEFILADYDEISEKLKYGWDPGDIRYNRFESTRQFCDDNSLKRFEIFNLEDRDISELQDIDLVISVMAVGFHYPIEQYFNKLLEISTHDVVMIFGVRKYNVIYNLNSFKDNFRMIDFKNVDLEVKEHIMILRGKK